MVVTGGVSNCASRSSGLGWENNLVQLLCLFWRFFFLPHLHYKEGAMLCTCLLRPYLTQLTLISTVTFSARIIFLAETMSSCMRAVCCMVWDTAICTVAKAHPFCFCCPHIRIYWMVASCLPEYVLAALWGVTAASPSLAWHEVVPASTWSSGL